MSAWSITFPYPTGKLCTINIDFKGSEYLLLWEGDWTELLDLTQFPLVDGASVIPVPHSADIRDLWTRSQVLNYGADSHIRILDSCSDGFPICKVGINDRQRLLLQEEFSIIYYLLSKAPVVRIHPEPLTDEDGLFGFRMEKLIEIDLDIAARYMPDIERAFDGIHRSGVVHYDISPSNIMLNEEDLITIIDFGRAGYIGEKVPSHKEKGIKKPENAVYTVDFDNDALETVSDIFIRKGCFN